MENNDSKNKESNQNKIKEIRERTGLSQSKFAEYFGIPKRTVQKWEINQAKPSDYIPEMMVRILNLEEKKGVKKC